MAGLPFTLLGGSQHLACVHPHCHVPTRRVCPLMHVHTAAHRPGACRSATRRQLHGHAGRASFLPGRDPSRNLLAKAPEPAVSAGARRLPGRLREAGVQIHARTCSRSDRAPGARLQTLTERGSLAGPAPKLTTCLRASMLRRRQRLLGLRGGTVFTPTSLADRGASLRRAPAPAFFQHGAGAPLVYRAGPAVIGSQDGARLPIGRDPESRLGGVAPPCLGFQLPFSINARRSEDCTSPPAWLSALVGVVGRGKRILAKLHLHP
jgi:hypothetical protein